MNNTLRQLILCSFVAAPVALAATPALAHKRVTVRLHNQSSNDAMTCTVAKVVTNTSGDDVDTVLATYRPKPKAQRSASVRERPQSFSLSVKPIIKRLDGSVIYPRLRLTCELHGSNSRNSSPLWDHTAKSFSSHRLVGSCRPGAYCSVRVERH